MKANFANFGTCKYCGKRILWIKMKSGKSMPCDPKIIGYQIPTEGKGSETLVTSSGSVISADRVYDDNADGLGYISHFATCEGKKAQGWQQGKEVIRMQTQEEKDEEIIADIISHWDDENWPPRMTADEYVMRKNGSRK